jgi:hypothetical protein
MRSVGAAARLAPRGSESAPGPWRDRAGSGANDPIRTTSRAKRITYREWRRVALTIDLTAATTKEITADERQHDEADRAVHRAVSGDPGNEHEAREGLRSRVRGGIDRKKDGVGLLNDGIALLSEYQQRLAAEATRGVVVVLQALDAAGKDGTIKHVMSGVNPQGVRVESFKIPSARELDQDFLRRYQQRWRCVRRRSGDRVLVRPRRAPRELRDHAPVAARDGRGGASAGRRRPAPGNRSDDRPRGTQARIRRRVAVKGAASSRRGVLGLRRVQSRRLRPL